MKGEGGANCDVGVGIGVVCAEIDAASATSCRRLWASPFKTSPRSVGEKEMAEQKPSDEVTSRVAPSDDLEALLVMVFIKCLKKGKHTMQDL